MAQNIEIPVSLGLQAAEGQVSHLRKILTEAVKIDSTAFRGLSQALQKAETDVAKLKSQMSTAFQSASGSKKFLSDYDKLFESLATIGNRFNFLKESEMIFSPENAEVIKNARAEMAQLSDEIQQIKSGKVGKLFEDDSVASIKEVREVANDLGVTLSKTTFQDFGQKISGAMTNVKKDLDDTRKQIELLKEAAKSADLKKDSIFSQLNIDKLMGNTAEVLDKNGAKTLRGQIAKLYEEYGLTDVELGKNIKAGSNIDQIFIAEEERIKASSEKYVGVLQEQKNKIQEEIDKFDEGLKQSGGNGKRANWETKLAYINEIKQKFAGLLTFSDVPASVSKDGTGITKYIESFKQELINGMKDLSTDDIARVLQEKIQVIFSNASTKSVITDLGSFKQQITVMMKETFGDLDLGDVTSGISVGWDFDKAIEMVVANIKAALQNLDPKELEGKAAQYEATLKKLENASKTVGDTERASTGSLKEKEAAFQALVEEVTKYVAAQLGITTGQVQAVLRGDTNAANQGRTALEGYIQSLDKLSQKQKALGNIQMAVNRWMGFWQVLNMTKSAINDMKQHIQELDTVMTSISVVTNFSQDDLWGQISQYSEIARQYGVAIKGVYEVSQIYYQQGLQQNDVMTLTTETLKMARIAGLDYATAADYMTTAIRGFKLEMTDAAHVTDVFSALAATTASSTEEIATAISKTASSAEAVGASFEATSAMMATMIATTRESATNIGTALKSVISRYGEMTSDPSKTVDSEGEEMSLNRVDKALQTVGITIHDTAGQFRDFDDVMLELMEKWDSLDSLSQRYIATLMAGNRQQSRFLALVSNVDEYKKALETAMDSEGAGELQTLKTLDSIDAKIEKMKVTIQEFYTSSGIEELYKNVIDTITNIISAANSLPKAFNKFPARALAVGMSLITTVKSVLTLIIAEIQLGLEKAKGTNTNFLVGLVQQYTQKGREAGQQFSNGVNSGLKGFVHSKAFVQIANIVGAAAQLIGSGIFTQGLSKYGASTSHDEDMAAVGQMRTGAVVSAVGGIASGAAMGFAAAGPLGALAGGVTALITQIPTLRTAFELNTETLARKIELDKKAETKAKEELSKDKGEQKGLENALDQLNKLKAAQYDSAEAAKEYADYMNQLGDQYPHLIESLDQVGNTIISVTSLEQALAEARAKTASSTVNSLEKEQERLKDEQEAARRLGDFNTLAQDTDFSNLLLEYFGETAAHGKTKGQNYKMANLVAAYLEDTGLSTKKEKTYNAVRQQTDASEQNARDYLSSPRQRQAVMDWAIEHYSSTGMEMDSAILEPLQSLLYSKVNDYITALPESNLLKFLKLDNVNQINSMGGSQLIELSKRIKQYSTDIFDSTAQTLETVDSALVNAQISSNVQSRLNAMATSEEQKKKDNAATLQNYLTLMSFIYSSMDDYEQSMEGLEQWILSHESDAQKLLSIDYSNFKDSKEIDFYGLDEIYQKAFINQFNKIREDSIELYTNQLNNILGEDWEDNYEWLKADNFNNKTLTTIQSNFKQYQSLIEKQQYAQAEAYFNSIKAIYGESGLGGLKGLQQTEAFDIIKDLDLSDPEALRSAAETFAEMGPEFAGLSEQFTDAALRWTTSAATLLEQLASSTKDTAKSIESSTSDMSKVFKYSEALEKAQALMDVNEGVKFDELFTYDKDLGGYIKTAKAFQLEMAELQNQQIEGISLAITDMTETLSSVFDDKDFISLANSGRTIETGQVKEKFAVLTHTKEGDANFDRLWLEYTQIIEAFRNQDKDWNTFITEYISENGTQLQLQLDEINNMSSQMAQLQLKSFDYTSIVSGKGTAQTKETLKALIQTSLKDGTQFDFNTFWTNLITGQIDNANEALAKAGLGQISKGQVDRARFEATLTAAQELGENKVYEALSAPTKKLLEEYGITSQSTYSDAKIAKATNGFKTSITNYINSGIASISEVSSYIDSQALSSGIGKQKVLLDAYGDQQFSTEELMRLGAINNVQFDKDHNVISYDMANEWKALLKQNTATGAWEINDEIRKKGQAAIIEALAAAYGIDKLDKLDESYEKALESGIEADNKQANKENSDLVAKSVFEQLSSAKIGSRINVNDSDLARYILRQAFGKEAFDANGQLVITSDEQLNAGISALESVLNDEEILSSDTKIRNPEVIKYINQMVADVKANHSKYTAISGALGATVSEDAANKLAESYGKYSDTKAFMVDQLGFIYDEDTKSYLATNSSIQNMQTKITELNTELASETNEDRRKQLQEKIATFQASLDDLKNSRDYKQSTTLASLLGNYTDITNQNIEDFKAQFSQLENFNIEDYLTKPDVTGKRQLKIGELYKALKPYQEQLGFNLDEIFSSYIGTYADTYTESIKKALSYTTSGTTSRAEVETFTAQLREALNDETITANDVFNYDSTKGIWKLRNDYLVTYAQKRAEQLGLIDEAYTAYVNDIIKENVVTQADSFINSLASGSVEHMDELQAALETYYMNIYNDTEKAKNQAIKTVEVMAKGGTLAVDFYKFFNSSATEDELAKVYSAAFDSWSSAVKQLTETTKGSAVTGQLRKVLNDLQMVDSNGVVNETFNMVQAYQEIYNRMRTTAGATTAGLNDVYAEMLTAEDQQNVDITAMLKNSQGMTYDALGKILARYNITLEEVLANEATAAAYGLERTGFGQVRLTDWESFAKKVFKTDNLDSIRNTDEYISAYKAYNDGLIKLNKDTEQTITDEIKQIEKAKGGDWLNLSEFGTQYYKALAKSTNIQDYLNKGFGYGLAAGMVDSAKKDNAKIFDNLNSQLNQWDATFENGILKLGDNANLLGIAQTLEQTAIDAGLKIGDGLEQIEDAILNVLKSYTDAITKGISGGLTVTKQTDLIQKANTLGVNNLSFEKTQDGLKLSQQSAIALYQALSKVDALQGKIVFDKLAESLQETNENFATTTALLNHMVDLRTKLASVDTNVPDSRRAEYEAELEVAKEIVAVRSAAKDDSFNFMDNKIPAGQNNPLNYAKNWTKALKAIKDAYKVQNNYDLNAGGVKRTRSGYMAYEDFYNIVNEINNMAGIMKQPIKVGKTIQGDALELDGSLESASNLILKGIDTLTAVDTGDMMVNIGALGINLAKGGKDLKNGIDKGIDAVADAQISALDGMIAMLELIVAMEQLGDITAEDTTIDLGDIFAVNGESAAEDNIDKINGFTKKFEEARGKLFNYLNKAGNEKAKEIFENTQLKIGDQMKSMFDLMNPANSFDKLFPNTLTPKQKASAVKAYQGVIDGLYQAAISGNYNLDDIGGSLQEILNATGHKFDEGFMLNVGDITYTVQSGVVVEAVDWSEETAQEILKQYKTRHEGTDAQIKAEIVSQIQDYLNGEGQTGDLTVQDIITLRHSTVFKHDKKGYYVEDPDGKPHYADDADGVYDKLYNEYILKDQQGVDKNATIEGNETTVEYGKKIKIKMKATVGSDGKVTWGLDGDFSSVPGLKDFTPNSKDTTQRALLEDMFAYANKHTTDKNGEAVTFPTVESWVYQTFGIHLKINTEVLKDNETVQDPTKDPKFRNVAEDFINQSAEEIKKFVSHNGEGKIEVDMGQGYKLVLDADDIEYDVETDTYNNDLLLSKLREAWGIDEALKDTIAEGVSAAIPALVDALGQLDDEPANSVATALQSIIDNATKALEAVTLLAAALANLGPANISVNTSEQTPEWNGSANAGLGSGAHEPEAITGEVSIEGTEKAEQDMNSFSSTIGSLGSTVQSAATSASAAASSMASRYSQAMSDMDTKTQDAAGSTRQHMQELQQAATDAVTTVIGQLGSIPTHISVTSEFTFMTPDGQVINTKGGYRGENGKITITVEGQEQIQEVKDEAAEPVEMTIGATTNPAIDALNKLIARIKSTYVEVSVGLTSQPSQIQSQINSRTYTASVQLQPTGGLVPPHATGNLGLAQAKGTLMGELGPELVVSNGRYFVAGQNGAEMVNLADDAIVFNHLQTEQLLKHGMSSGRGKAVTSEKNAVAFATGNTGPAMASASAALNALKTLRAMWESLRSASVSDLAGAGGGGGGGGGDKAVDPSIWIDTVERWYNLMQKIAKLEKEITHEETLRSKLESDWNANGNHYYASQKRSLEALRDQIDAQEQLNLSRQAYYDQRVEALEKSPFGKLIRFDDEGQMFFQEGAMEWLTKLAGFDSEGKANYTDEEKYNILMKAGYGDYMKYDSNGGEIKKDSDGNGEVTDDELQTFYGNATKAFWDRINDYKEATQSLWDSIKEGEDNLLDLQADQNSLLEEIRENQMEVEDEVLKAIEDLRQREIDALQDERDKLEESTQKYIDGLTDALNREKEMYQNQEDETSLNQQRRRLAILQRSGGSAEDIASLRSEIDSSERERYFNLQQQQIDAIQAASDLEIERMDSQIEIMTETLEYQKEYGLLWGNVYAVMQESADKIVSFITHGNSEFWTSSELASQKAINEQLFAAEQWTSYRDDLAAAKASIGENGVTAKDISENVQLMATMTREQMKDNDYRIFDEAMKKEFGNDYDKNGTYKDIFYSEYQEHGDLTKVTASARKKYSDDKKAAEAAKAAVKTVTSTGSGGGSGESGGDGGSSGGSGSGNKKQTYDVYDSRGFKTSYTVEASSKAEAQRLIAEKYGSSYSATTHTNTSSGVTSTSSSKKSYTSSNTTAAQTQNQNTTRSRQESKGILPNTGTAGSAATTKTIEQSVKTFVNNSMNTVGNFLKSLIPGKKASGGYVNHGVYELGELGTETVLTASQTKVLRDNILSNRPNSLISLLRSYNENYDGINSSLTGITPVEDNSVTIERVEMTMEVKQIANDYDAKRAGEQALNEMMRIARKTGATNSIRR